MAAPHLEQGGYWIISFAFVGFFTPDGTLLDANQAPLRVWIEDNGIGIDPAQLDRIWAILHQAHCNKVYEGTGIGLSIVKKAVERMGGRVGVDSQPGQGSRFWFELRTPSGHDGRG